MKIQLLLSYLLILSASSLTVGSFFLYVNALVPIILIYTTLVAVVVLFALSYFVAKRVVIAINFGTVLGIIAPIMSALTPQHVSVLSQLLGGGIIALLGLLQILGFYLFPIIYVVLRIVFRKSVSSLN